jgi:hypothetical protein
LPHGRSLVFLGLLLGWLAAPARAADYSWDNGGGDGLWSTPANWSPDGAPGTNDSFVDLADTATWNITIDTNAVISNVLIKCDGSLETAPLTNTVNWIGNGSEPTVTVLDTLAVYTNGDGDVLIDPFTLQASLNLTDIHLRIGASGSRGSLTLATRKDHDSRQSTVSGTLKVTRGSLSAWLSSVIVGWNYQDGGTLNTTAQGALDLSACQSVMLDVSGDFTLGYSGAAGGAYRRWAYGYFKSGGGAVTIGGDLRLADNSAYRAYKGEMYLTNTTVAVSGVARLNSDNNTADSVSYAWVYSSANGRCSGLDLRDTADALYVRNQNDADATNVALLAVALVTDPVGSRSTDAQCWYWGLRWKGDRETTLETFQNHAYPELTVNVSGLSDRAKTLHLDYLKKLRPATYGSYNGVNDLTPNDYVTYDSTTGYTYVGIHYAPPMGTVVAFR